MKYIFKMIFLAKNIVFKVTLPLSYFKKVTKKINNDKGYNYKLPSYLNIFNSNIFNSHNSNIHLHVYLYNIV